MLDAVVYLAQARKVSRRKLTLIKQLKLSPRRAIKALTKLIADLKLTDEQRPTFQALQKVQKAFAAEQKQRSAEEKKAAGKTFYKERNAKLKDLFTETQLTQWKAVQAKQRAAREKKAKEKK